ncbi:MAG: hypothetical protein J5645_08415 [Lachnospiraceae bacterium]|nr:hypothetical protein [Lachnospiraceae bacterium]
MTEMRIKQECEASARKARRMTPSVGASLTVEASFCVPVVFLAVYVFLQLFLFLRVQSEMQSAMSEVVREVSEYGTVYSKLSSLSEDDSDDLIAKLGIDKAIGRVASQAYMGYLLREKIRDASWIGWIRGGVSGVSTSGSSMFEEDGRVSLLVSYRFSAVGSMFSVGSIPVVQRIDAGSYHGRERAVEKPDDEDEEDEDEETVYVAANGTVYHRSATCTYLKLVIEQVAFSEVGARRNKDGEKYRPCTYCDNHPVGATVFLTGFGNRYHTIISCSELRRSYQSMTLSEAEEKGLRACSKCGAKDDE